jgi:hypothetical protein
MLYRKIQKDLSTLNHFLENKEYNIHKAYVLSNERTFSRKGKITYMPVYAMMVTFVRQYEKYLRPRFGEAVLAFYHQYVQQQASITDKEAYKRVAETLNWMTSFDGGTALVKNLVAHYRQTYARRPYMMKALDGVKL